MSTLSNSHLDLRVQRLPTVRAGVALAALASAWRIVQPEEQRPLGRPRHRPPLASPRAILLSRSASTRVDRQRSATRWFTRGLETPIMATRGGFTNADKVANLIVACLHGRVGLCATPPALIIDCWLLLRCCVFGAAQHPTKFHAESRGATYLLPRECVAEPGFAVILSTHPQSLLGGTSIIVGFIVSFSSGQNRLRQRIVLGLGIVDFIVALTVVVGTSLSLSGRALGTNSAACDIFGFFYQACTIVSAVWTVMIALVTYTTLVHPLSKLTTALEKRGASWVLGGLAYAIGIAPSIAGAIVWNMVDLGGICFYDSSSLEAKIMLFIPRGIAMLVTIGIYIALFIFFQRRDLSIFGNTMSSIADEEEEEPAIVDPGFRRRFSSLVSWNPRSSDMTQIHRHSLAPLPEEHLSTQRPSVGSEDTAVAPPTRRSSAIIIALPTSSASHSADDCSPDNEQVPFDRPIPSTKLRTPACAEASMLNPNYRFGSQEEAAESHIRTPDKGPRKLSARQLNRRLSLLMSLYPLAYLVLFSVSVARVINQLVTKDYVTPEFAKVSRWLVLAQGFVDGILYLVIELLFRRSVRSRT
ncbi:BZ3500_MvSof-1268-A1-R1_Chr1-3g01897 [Microbotryum saponariae]|uniref:BZ3500_MvSof-1268-A1-R1_Chr1-3g01897 protein n=1 Tax=Microbotryum saponariae TaxID=289078 RepID=A0A2X0KAM1_9BASI|nr:BZ3500_MvSof-1268-A1-R1_Chr1-3g01897 [Microbotryum saponariae]